MFTQVFAAEMFERLLAAALARSGPSQLTEILHCLAYFHLYGSQLQSGRIEDLVEADAPAWLADALKLLEAGNVGS